MNMTPREWLLADVARCYGLDKATWQERLEWARNHTSWEMGAAEPFLYESALLASQSASTGHLISLDATASGIQCLSLMAQDPVSAAAVNLGTDEVNNPYRRVQEHMGAHYPYDRVKKAVMTSFYESVATPLQLFGDDYDKFVQAARAMLPGPWLMKEAISSCMTFKDFYSWTMMDGFNVNMEVTTPVECTMDIGEGHQVTWVEHRRANVATKGLTANVTHSLDALVLREVLRRTHCTYQWNNNTSYNEMRDKDISLLQSVIRWQRSKFVTVECLQHMDEQNGGLVPQELRDEIDSRTKTSSMYIQPIHDCYRVKATDANKLFIIVREVMADLAYAKTAWWLLSQLDYQGEVKDDESKRMALRAQVLRSQYLIC
jgi:hypothetical protein